MVRAASGERNPVYDKACGFVLIERNRHTSKDECHSFIYRCLCSNTYISLYVYAPIYYTYGTISTLLFLLSKFSFCLCSRPLTFFFVCSHLSTFRCKGSTARKHGKHQSLIDNKFFKTLRNQIDCGFLKNLSINYLPYFPFCQYSYLAHKRFEMTVTPE